MMMEVDLKNPVTKEFVLSLLSEENPLDCLLNCNFLRSLNLSAKYCLKLFALMFKLK